MDPVALEPFLMPQVCCDRINGEAISFTAMDPAVSLLMPQVSYDRLQSGWCQDEMISAPHLFGIAHVSGLHSNLASFKPTKRSECDSNNCGLEAYARSQEKGGPGTISDAIAGDQRIQRSRSTDDNEGIKFLTLLFP